jgi:hypothetical protein
VCAERCGETTVLTDDVVDGVGDGDLDGLLILIDVGDGDRDEVFALAAVAFGLAFDLRLKLAYLDESVR